MQRKLDQVEELTKDCSKYFLFSFYYIFLKITILLSEVLLLVTMADSKLIIPVTLEPKTRLNLADPVGGMHRYEIGSRLVELIGEGQCLNLFEDRQRVGSIVRKIPFGEIWKEYTLLARYEKKGDNYFVTPCHEGFPLADKKEEVHPLDYLLRFI